MAITAKLQIDSVELNSQNSSLRIHTFSGQEYSAEYSSDLTSAAWINLPGSHLIGDGGNALVTDTNRLQADGSIA